MVKHKHDIKTTAPVALKSGQSDYHIPDLIPFHAKSTVVSCPACDTKYIVDEGFSHEYLLAQLNEDHAKKREHVPYFTSDEAFTTIADCRCGEKTGLPSLK